MKRLTDTGLRALRAMQQHGHLQRVDLDSCYRAPGVVIGVRAIAALVEGKLASRQVAKGCMVVTLTEAGRRQLGSTSTPGRWNAPAALASSTQRKQLTPEQAAALEDLVQHGILLWDDGAWCPPSRPDRRHARKTVSKLAAEVLCSVQTDMVAEVTPEGRERLQTRRRA
jgi:hypothetical protein